MGPATETETTDPPPGSMDPGETAGPSPALRVLVPCMLGVSSLFMALAWIGHLRFKELPFLYALGLCWLLVLPEYFLNVRAIRMGYVVYSGAQMAAFRLCSGVVFVALTARYVLKEELGTRQLAGFGVMLLAMLLIAAPSERGSELDRRDASGEGPS